MYAMCGQQPIFCMVVLTFMFKKRGMALDVQMEWVPMHTSTKPWSARLTQAAAHQRMEVVVGATVLLQWSRWQIRVL